ncbi:stalk domain-containing protein [uncultured Paenibacillus sp.]|uniref:stalk domain-containing protein n=1 Tax=uncultured Paenibacillus sp. TaxID=227322 RepID=UPI0015A8EC17|nr:stalk domain-containing protein [uncultured Paenibacillus sp.]
MKTSKVLGMILASAVVATTAMASSAAAEAGHKAAVAKTSASQLKVVNQSVVIDGVKVTLKTVSVNKTVLYSLRDLAGGLGASIKQSGAELTVTSGLGQHAVTLKAGSKGYRADGVNAQFTVAPQSVQGSVYVEPAALVQALGGEVLPGTGELRSTARLSGQFSTPWFDAAGKVIVSQDDAETVQLFKLGNNGQSELFSDNGNVVGAALSPDLTTAAFTDENGALFLMNTGNGTVKKFGSDTTVKTDLTWSADGKKIYFIQGDKQEKIAYISLDTAQVTEVLADKVENKAEVQVSPDEKKLVYFVNVTGKAETDKEGTEESLTIDYSKAGTQAYSLELGKKDAKPVQLTKELDNKLYLSLLPDGSAAYISADPDGATEGSVLKLISADGTKISNLVADADVISSHVMNGKLVILAEDANGSHLYEVAATGAKTELYATKASVSEWALAKNGTIALIVDGKVILVQGGKSTELTK